MASDPVLSRQDLIAFVNDDIAEAEGYQVTDLVLYRLAALRAIAQALQEDEDERHSTVAEAGSLSDRAALGANLGRTEGHQRQDGEAASQSQVASDAAIVPRLRDSDELDTAAAQLLIELAFLVPRGTDVSKHPIAAKLERYKGALLAARVREGA